MNLLSFRNAALLVFCYLLVLAAYVADELGLVTFRSKRLEAFYSQVSFFLFVICSICFMILAGIFVFVWGFKY